MAKSKPRFSLTTSTEGSNVGIWLTVDPSLVLGMLDALARKGVGITVALTRDKSAVSFTLLDGTERIKAYAKNTEELETLLEIVRMQAEISTET